MIPKCNGSIPVAVTIGKNIGVNINTAGVISMKIPINKRIVFIIRIIIIGLSLNPKMISFIKRANLHMT